MADQATGNQDALVLRTPDGVWFKIPAEDLSKYSMSEDEVARLQEQVPGSDDTQGHGTGTGSGTSYGWREMYYFLIGLDPSFTKYR